MKKILFFISAFFILTFAAIPTALAKEKETIIIPQTQTINHDYFGFADRVEINGTINGDAYVAGGVVIINGTINGDILTAGGNVTISGVVTGDIRAAGGNIQLTGAEIEGNVTLGGGNVNIDQSTKIGGSIVAGSGNLQIFAPIGRGATLGGGSILLANTIGSDVKAASEDLSLTQDAKINGNLTYWSENDVNLSDGASVSGKIVKELPKDREMNQADAQFAEDIAKALGGLFIAVKVLDLFWLAIFGLLIVILLPNFTSKTADCMHKKFGWALLFGFLTLILIPVIGMILMISLIGIPVAILLFFFFMFIFWIGRVFAIFTLGRYVMSKASRDNKSKSLAYLVGLLIYLVLCLLPIIGFITSVTVSLAGAGALLASKKETYQDLRKKDLL